MPYILIPFLPRCRFHGLYPARKRRERERSAQALKKARTEADGTTFYWDAVSKEVPGNVVKFLSSSSTAEHGVPYTPLGDILALFGARSGLARALKTEFSMLCISKTVNCSDEHSGFGWKLRPEEKGWTDDIRVAHEFVLAGGRRAIKTLIVGEEMFTNEDHGTRMVDDFLKFCPNVTSLSVCETKAIWTKKFGGQVEVFELASSLHGLRAVPKYCTSLRSLSVHSPADRGSDPLNSAL